MWKWLLGYNFSLNIKVYIFIFVCSTDYFDEIIRNILGEGGFDFFYKGHAN